MDTNSDFLSCMSWWPKQPSFGHQLGYNPRILGVFFFLNIGFCSKSSPGCPKEPCFGHLQAVQRKLDLVSEVPVFFSVGDIHVTKFSLYRPSHQCLKRLEVSKGIWLWTLKCCLVKLNQKISYNPKTLNPKLCGSNFARVPFPLARLVFNLVA